ncbi:hypothetical protein BC943DRAFT_328761 [Umbelopsis sp. AD052]|nr:hypothetical protein BC943DRAFT_328761 [Umbelopsis sp. AD052]
MDAVISYCDNTLFGTANVTSDIPDLGAIDKDYIFVMESHRDAGYSFVTLILIAPKES